MQIFKKPNFKFMKFKYYAFFLSGILILFGIINITVRKGLNYGIDFAGGTLIQVRFKEVFPIDNLRNILGESGLGNNKIQEVGDGQREYIIRTMLPESETQEELESHVIIGNKVIVNTLRLAVISDPAADETLDDLRFTASGFKAAAALAFGLVAANPRQGEEEQ